MWQTAALVNCRLCVSCTAGSHEYTQIYISIAVHVDAENCAWSSADKTHAQECARRGLVPDYNTTEDDKHDRVELFG